MKKWICVVCGYIYDEKKGLPDEGIKAGTRWEDVPEIWTCPDCGVTKADFELLEVDEEPEDDSDADEGDAKAEEDAPVRPDSTGTG